MKIILIIQSLIILAGAYYIFLFDHKPTPVMDPVGSEPLPEQVATTSETTVLDEESVELQAEESGAISGPNDAGMEWPVFDGELESR